MGSNPFLCMFINYSPHWTRLSARCSKKLIYHFSVMRIQLHQKQLEVRGRKGSIFVLLILCVCVCVCVYSMLTDNEDTTAPGGEEKGGERGGAVHALSSPVMMS